MVTELDAARERILAARTNFERVDLLDKAERLRLLGQAMERSDVETLASVLMRDIERVWADANPPVNTGRSSGGETGISDMPVFSKGQRQMIRSAAKLPADEYQRLADTAIEAREPLTREAVIARRKEIAQAKSAATREANRDAAYRAQAERVREAADRPSVVVHHADIADLAAMIGEPVDAVVTDPPYQESDLGCWSALAEFAGGVLRPGGTLAVLSGKIRLPDVIAGLTSDPRLKYEWVDMWDTGIEGSLSRVRASGRIQSWKPIIVLRRLPAVPNPFALDRIRSDDDAGKYAGHMWQQTLSGTVGMVERYCGEGELVVDPFLGAGTTGLACMVAGRRFVGGDRDPAAVAAARERLLGSPE